ncbi:hypothetical protein D1227_18540 [Henriciella mobilis]|uniref:hypothetical protein n=1 Tax=Henriciella mobilis TaxID=2305467 RepID=UPI000E660696|nr:hypothetical protein [Henriciella mobilis]RIJ15496.1 hypothetical protein D1231_12190 [Henriciella mobilis]RIJ18960.1 hypothetical protein D1227_18540 [Henriciella mobilis]
MFKRPRLSAQTFPVNAGIAGFLLFYAASCSGPQEPEQPAPESGVTEAPGTAETTDQAATEPDTLPAVWMTRELDFPVRSIGLAGGAGSTFAVAYDGAGLQVFNFDGERISEVSDHDVAALAQGRYMLLSGTPVTLYPGIDAEGELKVWLHGGGIQPAIEYDLRGAEGSSLAGICAAEPADRDSALLRIAYWTEASPAVLEIGDLVESGGELEWQKSSDVSVSEPIEACTFIADQPQTFAAPVAGASGLKRLGRETLVTLGADGRLDVSVDGGDVTRYDVIDGITVVVPDQPKAIAATGDARSGGYPGGLIVLGGDIEPGDHRVVMVDPSKVTLTPLTEAAVGQ